MNNKQDFLIQDFLTKTQLFQGFSPEYVDELVQMAIAQNYQENEMLFCQRDETSVFLWWFREEFVLSPDGKEQILHIFCPGEHFAEVPAKDGQCFPASGAAIAPSQVLFFTRPAFIFSLKIIRV